MRPRIPSLNWLRVFEAAARLQSFAAAARELNMTASAVSQQVRALEGHFGSDLFTRGARSIALTETGRAFLPSVQNSLRLVETTAGSLFGSRARTSLTVQVVTVMALSWLAPRLTAFRADHPEILLTVTTENGVENFTRGDADLRIYFGDGPIGRAKDETLCGEMLYPVAIPAIAGSVGAASDLVQWPLIDVMAHRSGWLQVIEALDPGLDVPETNLIFVDNTPLAFAIAASGGGIALARAPITNGLMDRFGLTPCLGDFPGIENHGYRLAHAGLDALSPAARTFRAWLLSELGLDDQLAASAIPGTQA